MNISTFVNWSKEKGIKTDASVKKTPYVGYGLFSKETIDGDSPTVLVHIPNDLVLTSHNALKVDSDFAQEVYKLISKKYNTTSKSFAQDKSNERLVLCLFLIYCKFINPSTTWKCYIDILPTLEFFKENHILFKTGCVIGTSLENSIRAKLSNLKRELDEINTIGQKEEAEEEESAYKSSWLSNIQLEMFIWADCVFWSRVVGIGGGNEGNEFEFSSPDMALIPFFDFANHSVDESNIRWQLNTDKGIDLVTYPNKIVSKGEELLISYGSKPNQELLFLYGFCTENNPEPSRFTIPLLTFLNPGEAPYNLQKIQWLKQLGVRPLLILENRDNNEGNDDLTNCGWTVDSIVVMYLVALNEDNEISFSNNENDLTQFILSGENIKSLDDLQTIVKKMNIFPIVQLRVAIILLEALKYYYSLVSKNTAISEEEIESSFLWKQANIYRREEKCTLKTAIGNLSSIIDNLMKHPAVVTFLQSVE